MSFRKEYTVLDEIGQGGFAKVVKVRHNELGYIRAIRMLKTPIVRGEKDVTYVKFIEECKILLRLGNGNNSNIIHIYQPRLLDNLALVEMDYVEGQDLTHYLETKSSFVDLVEVIRLLKDIGGALAYCHEDIYKFCMDKDIDNLPDDPNDLNKPFVDAKNRKRLIDKYKVIHNDIHSGNIMRKEDGSFVLLDFGLAIDGDEVIRSSKKENGAPEFKAPEKWDKAGELTTESDIYSFGVVLYEFLAGQTPFPVDKKNSNENQAILDVCNAHKKEIPKEIYELRKRAFESSHPNMIYEKDYPEWLETLIKKCLSKNPKDRYKNGKDLFNDILAYIANDTTDDTATLMLRKENIALQAELMAIKSKINSSNKAVDDFVADLQDRLQEARTNNEDLTLQIANLQTENSSLRANLDEISLLADEEEKEIISSLKKELSESDDKITSINDQLSSVISECEGLKEERNKLKKLTNKKPSNLALALYVFFTAIIAVIGTMVIMVNKAKSDSDNNNAIPHTTQVFMDNMVSKNDSLAVVITNLETKLQSTTTNASRQNSEQINYLNSEIKRLKSEKQNMVDRGVVDELKGEVEALRNQLGI